MYILKYIQIKIYTKTTDLFSGFFYFRRTLSKTLIFDKVFNLNRKI